MASFGINYSPNPSFESNTTSWVFSNCTGTRTTFATPGTGNYSCKLVSTSAAPIIASHFITGLTVGKRYNASFYSYTATAQVPFSMQAAVFPWIGVTNSNNTVGQWTRQWVAFTATTTAISLTIQSTTNNVVGDVVYIDRIKITDGEFMGPYFDGNYPYSSWSGTTNNSSSTCTAFVSSFNTGSGHSEDPIVANGLCLNNLAWNITSKSGRYTTPSMRGSNTAIPGQRGQTFVKNKPVDVGIYNLTMWILGCFPDGSIPSAGEAKRVFDANYTQVIQNVFSVTSPVSMAVWQMDGSVRACTAALNSSVAADLTMGGRRAELTLPFDVMEGAWADAIPTTITGTAGTHWTSDTLVLSNLAGGTAPIEDAVVTVNGPITNPRITDNTTGTWVQYTGTVAAGQTWTVDSGEWTSYVANVSKLSSTQHYGHPRFLVIDPGQYGRVPQITLSGAATGSATNITVLASRQHNTA